MEVSPLVQGAAPTTSPPLVTRGNAMRFAAAVGILAAVFGILDAYAPTEAEVYTHTNYTCPAQKTICNGSLFSSNALLIQFTEAAIILVLLLTLWWFEK